jgi:hypothetical protein
MKPVQQFQVNGRTIQDVYVSDNGRRLKNVVQMVGASADNGKNPQLMTTIANKLGYQHLIGPGKYSEGMFAKTKEVLGNKFPDTYKLVDDLFN